MAWIVLETHGGAEYATIVTNEDGSNKVFDSYIDAEQESKELQDRLIVEI